MFDPFVGPTGSWAFLAAPTSDGVAHLPALGAGQAYSKLSEEFLIETTVRFPTPAADARFEVLAQGSGDCGQLQSCSAYMFCTLTGDGHLVLKSFTGQPDMSTEVLGVSGPILLWVRSTAYSMSPVGGLKQHCVGVDVHGAVVSLVAEITSKKDGLRYSANFTAGPQPVDVKYVWLVSN